MATYRNNMNNNTRWLESLLDWGNRVVRLLWSRRLAILTMPGLCAVAALGYLIFTAPIHDSDRRLSAGPATVALNNNAPEPGVPSEPCLVAPHEPPAGTAPNCPEPEVLPQQRPDAVSVAGLADRVPAPGPFDGLDGRILDERLQRLSQALADAEIETLDARAGYQALNAIMDDPAQIRALVESRKAAGQFAGFGPGAEQLCAELTALRQQLEPLSHAETADPSELRAIRARIARLERDQEAMNYRFAQACRNAAIHRWVTAMAREDQIRNQWRQRRQINRPVALLAAAKTDMPLESEPEPAVESSPALDSRSDESPNAGQPGDMSPEPLPPVTPSQRPVWTGRYRVVSNALMAGLLLGVMLALMLEWLDQRVRDAAGVASLLGVSVLGEVPGRPLAASTAASPDRLRSHGLMAHYRPDGPVAGACRTICSAILEGFGLIQSSSLALGKTILVTSAEPGAGKSTLVSNLALTLAQTGRRVLILDGDLRKPDQHRIFEVNREKDLASALIGRCELNEAILPEVATGVDLLPACAVPEWDPKLTGMAQSQMSPGPAELLSGPAFLKAIDWLSDRYDVILIDSPPALTVADALIVASVCDQTLLVLRAGQTTRRALQQMRDGLLDMGAVIMGAVINGVAHDSIQTARPPGLNGPARPGSRSPAAAAGLTADASPIQTLPSADSPILPRRRARR